MHSNQTPSQTEPSIVCIDELIRPLTSLKTSVQRLETILNELQPSKLELEILSNPKSLKTSNSGSS